MLILFGIFISSLSFYRGWFAENSNNSATQVHFSALSSSLAYTHGKNEKNESFCRGWSASMSSKCNVISLMIYYSKCIRRPQNVLSNTTISFCQITKFQISLFFIRFCVCVLFLFVRFEANQRPCHNFPLRPPIQKFPSKFTNSFSRMYYGHNCARAHIKLWCQLFFFVSFYLFRVKKKAN